MTSYNTDPPTAEFLAQSRVLEYLAGCIVPLTIATIFVWARIYSRAVILRIWGADDMLIAISWACSVVLTALDCLLIRYGAGKHIQTLTVEVVVPQNILAYTVRLFYQLVLSTTKLGICAFYLRVFTDRKSTYIIWGLMAFVILFTIPLLLVQIFQCKPISDAWSLDSPNCPVDELTVVNITGVFNILGDVVLLVFVVPKILALQMASRQKVALLAILATSLLVIVASIIRTRLVAKLANSPDPSWDNVIIGIWSLVEVNTGIFCASIATIKPLIRQLFPGLLSTHEKSSKTYGQGGGGSYGIGTKSRTRDRGSQAFELHSIQDNDNLFESKAEAKTKSWAS